MWFFDEYFIVTLRNICLSYAWSQLGSGTAIFLRLSAKYHPGQVTSS